MAGVRQFRRNHLLDLLRILLAVSVIVGHAAENIDGNRTRDPFSRLMHTTMSIGDAAVDFFFLLSGYLIVKSWQADPDLFRFVSKRFLRIVPGYLVAAFVSVLAVGTLAPGTHHFFSKLGTNFFRSVLLLGSPQTPPVLPGEHFAATNTPMWTIAYEFRCYLIVALVGSLRLLRGPIVWLGLTTASLALAWSPALRQACSWHRLLAVTGDPLPAMRLFAVFAVGGSFFLLRRQIPLRWELAIAAATALLLINLFFPPRLELALMLFGGYILFFLTSLELAFLSWMEHVPDISYGMYLYGWPVECLWIWYVHGSPWVASVVATTICVPIAWLSWHFVERPMLQLKRRASAPLPPS